MANFSVKTAIRRLLRHVKVEIFRENDRKSIENVRENVVKRFSRACLKLKDDIFRENGDLGLF